MSNIVQVSAKGQVTLPEPMRRRLGLTKGAVLSVEERGGEIVLRQVSVFPTRLYSDEEIAQWVAEDTMTDEERERLHVALEKMAQKG